MQPTYLPWLGYFNLMASVEHFVFLDNVQFSKQSWQQRNRVIVNDRLLWLTVPVLSHGRSDQLIDQVEVKNDTNWRSKHQKTIAEACRGAPSGKLVMDLISEVLAKDENHLCEINISLITAIADLLQLKCKTVRASHLGCPGGRSDRLLAICRKLGATEYFSPSGSREYLEADGVFANAHFPVAYQQFSPPAYRTAEPIAAGENPSIIDAIAWIGPEETRNIVYGKAL